MARFQPSVSRKTKAPPDPFRLGWRDVQRRGPDGNFHWVREPLTKWDVLHPQEYDYIVQNNAHARDRVALRVTLDFALRERADMFVSPDLRVDWQEPGIIPHGPDLVVFGGLKERPDDDMATFRVHDMEAAILLVIEVTSPNTRRNDVGIKMDEYFLAKVPYYLIVDNRKRKRQPPSRLIGHRAGANGFELMESDAEGGILIPNLDLTFRIHEGRVRCFDNQNKLIPEPLEMAKQIDESMARQIEMHRQIEQHAERAEQEKQRAEQAEARIRELESKLSDSQGRK